MPVLEMVTTIDTKKTWFCFSFDLKNAWIVDFQ